MNLLHRQRTGHDTVPETSSANDNSRPPGMRPLATAVLIAIAVGIVVAVTTILRFDELVATTQAANPGQSADSITSTLWSRIGVAALAVVIWPLLLRRLSRGKAKVYARIQRVSIIAALALLAVLLLGTAPAWLHALQAVQAAAQLGVFATTLRPELRNWYAAHRTPPDCPRAWRPILLLAVLAPLTAEITIGNIPFTTTGALAAVFTVPIYAAGSVLVRELARRVRGGWPVVLGLGVAYFLMEEGVGLQSLFSPTLYHAADLGARVAGINLVFGLLQLVNHAVWSIAVPIALTELVFPETRDRRWLGRPGVILTGVLYLAGVALMIVIHLGVDPNFFAPATTLLGTFVLAILVAVASLTILPRLHKRPRPTIDGPIPRPLTVGAIGLVASFAFLAILNLPGDTHLTLVAGPGVLVPILLALADVGLVACLVLRWSRRTGWNDVHVLALCGGSLLGHSLMWGLILPTTAATAWGVVVLFLASVLALTRLYRRIDSAT